MTDSAVIRNGKLVYMFSPGAAREAVPGVAYERAFAGREHRITARAECCLARYRRKLQPGETFSATFKMPRVPATNAAYKAKLAAADYQTYRDRTAAYWRQLLAQRRGFRIPGEAGARRPAGQLGASAARHPQSRRAADSDRWPSVSRFFLTSYRRRWRWPTYPPVTPEFAVKTLPQAVIQQEPDGLYLDRALAHGQKIPAAHGHILYATAMTVLFTRDQALAEQVFPSCQAGGRLPGRSMNADPYGLLPPAWPYDNEMINGHYTCNNLWALLGLRNAIRLANFIGKNDEASAWVALEQRYEANILKGIEASVKPDGYVPPGLYPYLTGPKARPGFAEYQTHSDWENMLLAYPTETLSPSDPRVRGTVDHVRKGYAEGVMTYRHGMHLHQYITGKHDRAVPGPGRQLYGARGLLPCAAPLRFHSRRL